MNSLVDVVPYNQDTESGKTLELELIVRDFVDFFSTECFLPTDSDKWKLMERAKQSLRQHNNLDVVRKSRVVDTIDELKKNPPSFSGIDIGGEKFGNKFIDAGWESALDKLSVMLRGL